MSEVLSAGNYESAKAREYQELMDIINRRGDQGYDRYGELMKKEERVLDTVDRVVNDARLQQIRKTSVFDMSIIQVMGRTAEVVHDIYLELFTVRSTDDLKDVFLRPERQIYIGIVVVLIGFFLGFIQMIASPSSSRPSYSQAQQSHHLPWYSPPYS